MPALKLNKDSVLNMHYILATDIPIYLEKHPEISINTKFSFLLNYNIEMLTPVFEATVNASKSKDPAYNEFEKNRREILVAAAERNKAGQPIRTKSGFLIAKDKAQGVNEKLAALTQKYTEAIETRKTEEKEIEAMLKEEIDVMLCQTSFSNFPTWLDPWQMKVLRPLILESDEQMMALIAS